MIRIASRFRGPPDSGNGGYCAGLLASHLDGDVEVTLRSPPPLEQPLTVSIERERAELRHGELLIASAVSTKLERELPSAPSFERATDLSRHYIGHERHHFPGCFVCGPARAEGDGLRIFPGAERPATAVSAPWIPDASLTDASGKVRSEFVWAALDCVGYFGSAGPDYPVALLGRMTVKLASEVQVGERCVVHGWSLSREGRKLHAGTAIFGADGEPRAWARQTWILLNHSQ